jgi:hypothetical protein
MAEEKRATALVEQDLQEALESTTNAGSAQIELRHWPEVEPLDLLLDGDVAVELQWCQSGDDLAGCAWDIAKLACAVGERKVAEGWIVAGAPSWHWDTHRPGVELFTPRVYLGDDLVADYEDWWRLWCNEITTRPTHLPLSFAVADADQVDARLGRVPFVLRIARVDVLKHTWNPYICPHRWHHRQCLPRPWDLDGTGGVAA